MLRLQTRLKRLLVQGNVLKEFPRRIVAPPRIGLAHASRNELGASLLTPRAKIQSSVRLAPRVRPPTRTSYFAHTLER